MLLLNGDPADRVPVGPWALHGASVFTTLRAGEGAPVLLDSHLERLRVHARALGIAHPGDAAIIHDLDAAASQGGRILARVTLAEGLRLVQTRPLEPPPPDALERGVGVCVTARQVHPELGRFKTGNHLVYRLAAKDAEAAGAFEGLLVDAEGHVVDGSRTSLLLVDDDALVILEGGLEGITRSAVAEFARDLGLRVRRARLRPEAIWDRRAIAGNAGVPGDRRVRQLLLAGTGVGLVPVGPPRDPRVRALIERFRL